MFASQSGKANLSSFVATYTIRFHQHTGTHLFQSQIQIVGDKVLVLREDQWSVVDRRRWFLLLFFRWRWSRFCLLLGLLLFPSFLGIDGRSSQGGEWTQRIPSKMNPMPSIDQTQPLGRVNPVLLPAPTAGTGYFQGFDLGTYLRWHGLAAIEMQTKHLLDAVVNATNERRVTRGLLSAFSGVFVFTMHTTNSDLSKGDRFVSTMHWSSNIFFRCTECLREMSSEVHLQFGQPILVVVQSQGNASGIPLLDLEVV
mmetsp:Transcript_7489/g.18732  ORF Transcript_7489/g.18732 Transcript_7489/m.18732 type:complete len:255 (+) Transcript_7489:1981-2745(+)